MDTHPKLLTIAELIYKSLSLSGTSSLTTSTNPKPHQHQKQTQTSNPNPNPKTLTSLNYPTIIIGTLNLPTDTTTTSSSNPITCNCFSFSDGSSMVCCAVLDFDVRMIGKRIHVLSWNFIPFRCGGAGSGLLEIIRWNTNVLGSDPGLAQCSNINAFPLDLSSLNTSVYFNGIFSARSGVFGKLESISPVSVVPCTVQDRSSETASKNVSGFLAEVLVCNCKFCSSKVSIGSLSNSREGNGHLFNVAVIVYFFQSGSSWHPVLSQLVGRVICITGLKKKLVYIGKNDSCLMFITNEKSALSMPLLPPIHLPFQKNEIKGNGELGAYSGIVTGFYMQGMLVELDEKVWLLVTDQIPHSIRIGALVCLKNVHFVRPKFSWTRILLLGACAKTNITVKSFSPLDSQCHVRPQTHSMLSKFIESLGFSARFWLLLIVSSFKKIFAGRFSEKEILGSKHKEGLTQLYAKSHLPSCVFRPRQKLFMEFCNHKLCGCGNEPNCSDLKLVVPLSSFISHCEASWVNFILRMQNGRKTARKNLYWCEGKSYYSSTRRIMPSEDVGIILMGTLQISPSSGRLQMVDASGSIDVVIPDLPSEYDANNVYEVTDYTVVIEGIPEETDVSLTNERDLFSCKRIFIHNTSSRGVKPSAIYVHFYMRNTTCLNHCLHLPCKEWSDNLMGFEAERFHIVLVTHKFPAIEKFHFNPINKPNSFVEAIILPWDLFLPGGHKDVHMLTEFSGKHVNEDFGYTYRKCSSENQCHKRPKISFGSTRTVSSTLTDNSEQSDNGSIGCSNSCNSPNRGCSTDRKIIELDSSSEMPCVVHMRSFNNQRPARPGVLVRANCNVLTGKVGKLSPQKMMLEFKPECFRYYRLLQVGGYYIMKYGKEVENGNGLYRVTGGKTLVTSQTPVWSVSLSCDDVKSDCELLQKTLLNPASTSTNLVPCENPPSGDIFFQRSLGWSLQTCHSDIDLHLSVAAWNQLKLEMETMEDGMTKPMSISEETGSSHAPSVLCPGPAYSDCRLSQGSLISLHGNIVSLHSFDCYPVDFKAHLSSKGVDDIMHVRGLPTSICIHISKGKNVVKLRGSIGKYAYPIGMGPGASATFHRVLVIGQDELMLTSVSFIVINSLKHVDKEYNGSSNSQFGSGITSCKLLKMLSSSLFSDLIQLSGSYTMRFRCRVLAIHVLVLENRKSDLEGLHSRMRSRAPVINIPCASFIIDDGSLPCCCWASSERAATLLRLDVETVVKPICSDSWRLNRSNVDKSSKTASHHLEEILKKHRRITVKNYGGLFDSSCQDLTFSVDSNNVFNRTDENCLKLIIANACCSPVLNVVGTIMDSNAIKQLVELSGMHLTMDTMQNVWATEVQYADLQTEAADLIEELTKQ